MITAPAVNPGRLDRRLNLRYPTETRNGLGESVPVWVQQDAIWGGWLSRGSREFRAAQAQFGALTGVLRIRWRASVAASWLVWCESVLYKLVGEPIEIGRREWLDLPLETVNPGGATTAALQQNFTVALDEGDTSAAITWPTAYTSAPSSVQITLGIPGGGEVFYFGEVTGDRTTTGTTIELGAAVPGEGYSLSITVTA